MTRIKSVVLAALLFATLQGGVFAAEIGQPRGLAAKIGGLVDVVSSEIANLGHLIASVEPGSGASRVLTGSIAPSRPAAAPITHGAFSSVAIPVGNIGMAVKWQQVTARDHSAFFTGACQGAGHARCDSAFGRNMRQLHTEATGLSQIAQLRLINYRINSAIRYKSDQANWGTGDHWATPSDIARNGAGDCEDYALAKMWMLRALGFAPEQLQLVVVQDTRRRLYHAVLAVHVGGERYILDNLSNTARLDSAINNYMPLVSFAANRTFIHGFDQNRAVNVAMPSDLGAVRPGEGV